jgi:hypothetical protein
MLNKLTALLSGDVAFLGLILVIFFGYAMYFGRGRIISLILSFYPATILYKAFPFMDKLTMESSQALVLGKLGLFILFLIPINIVIGKYIFSESFYSGGANIFRNFGLSAIIVILIILLSYSTISFNVIHDFSPAMDAIFAGTDRVFWWNLAPILLLMVL